MAPLLLYCAAYSLGSQFLTYRATLATRVTPADGVYRLSVPTPKSAGISVDALTAYGTVALAALTLVTLVTTVIISWNGDRRLRSERQGMQDKESLAEAYAVQVGGIATTIVINHSRYTIKDVAARLRAKDSLVDFEKSERIVETSGYSTELGADIVLDADFQLDILTPWDRALRFSIDPAHVSDLVGAYPVVRWTDRLNNRWEHRKGGVVKIDAHAPWSHD